MATAAPTLQIPDPPPEGKPAPAKPASMVPLIGGMLVLTGLGLGAGALFGLHVAKAPAPAAAVKTEAAAAPGTPSRYGPNVNVRVLPAIVTNLAPPERTWVRLEAALVMENEQSAEANVLAAAISEDIVAFLRTVSMRQIEGASGFQHLREDLNDRVRVRSSGKVRDLVIQALVVE
jgi:flagellar protein FliL